MFPWELLYGVGTIIFAGGLIWALWQNSKRTQSEKSLSDAAGALAQQRPHQYDEVQGSLNQVIRGYGDLEKAELLSSEEREKSVVITDPSNPENPMIYISDQFEKQTGYSGEEALGKNCRFLQGPNTDPDAIEKIRRALKTETEISVDILNYRRDGTEFWNRLRIRPLRDDRGKVVLYAGVQNPIDESEVKLEVA